MRLERNDFFCSLFCKRCGSHKQPENRGIVLSKTNSKLRFVPKNEQSYLTKTNKTFLFNQYWQIWLKLLFSHLLLPKNKLVFLPQKQELFFCGNKPSVLLLQFFTQFALFTQFQHALKIRSKGRTNLLHTQICYIQKCQFLNNRKSFWLI